MFRLSLLVAALVLAPALAAQQEQAKPIKSHEVNADGSITLRYRNASAAKVILNLDASLTAVPMVKGEDGVWTLTTPPLPPEYYSYNFDVDGVTQLDPLNREVVPNLIFGSNTVLVPGATPQPWEFANIAHGEVSHHYLPTHTALHLPQDQEPYIVYTPPHYDAKRKGGYPVLYLLHGFTDNELGWTAVGHADWILDTLIDSGQAVPMIVVMPEGYGDYEFVSKSNGSWSHAQRIDANVSLLDSMLTSEIIPAVEREYNVAHGRDNRAIAGLSMGGLQSVSIGLHHTDQFAWVGAFSSALQQGGFDEKFPGLTPANARLRLLWVSVGDHDALAPPNREFVAWARAKGFAVTSIEPPGKHSWLVWRDNLVHFAPLLFR